MSVHAIKHFHAALEPQNTLSTAKTGAQPVTGSTPNVPVSNTGFAALFSNYISTPVKSLDVTAAPPAPFTATYETGASVTGPDGSQTTLNPNELATASTAAEVAQLLGGTVVNDSQGGGFTSSVPTREIAIPGSNVRINAGLAANLFATYGTAAGSQAWVNIDQDLGLS